MSRFYLPAASSKSIPLIRICSEADSGPAERESASLQQYQNCKISAIELAQSVQSDSDQIAIDSHLDGIYVESVSAIRLLHLIIIVFQLFSGRPSYSDQSLGLHSSLHHLRTSLQHRHNRRPHSLDRIRAQHNRVEPRHGHASASIAGSLAIRVRQVHGIA